jgi:5-methylcytosine-specific restriction protein A
MPPKTKRPCRHSGCAALTNDRSGYCDQHREQHVSDGWQRHTGGKSRQQRGYGRPWEIRRARILMRDNYACQEHRRMKLAAVATHVDHIKPKAHGGTDDDDNLESLCAACHRAKTATERLRK